MGERWFVYGIWVTWAIWLPCPGIYSKNSVNLYWMTDDLETWCASFWTLPRLLKWWPFINHNLFKSESKSVIATFVWKRQYRGFFSDSVVHQSWYICNQLNKLLNTRGQGHLLTLVLGPSDLVLLNSLKILSNRWKLNYIQSISWMGKSKIEGSGWHDQDGWQAH